MKLGKVSTIRKKNENQPINLLKAIWFVKWQNWSIIFLFQVFSVTIRQIECPTLAIPLNGLYFCDVRVTYNFWLFLIMDW